MRKLMIVNICAILFVFLTSFIYGEPAADEDAVYSLMEERIAILNNYYGGKMSYDDARNNISKISTGSLYSDDVKIMKAWENADIDQITSFDIEIASCQRTSHGIIKGEMEVHWVLKGAEGTWETCQNYYFTAEEQKGKMKLSQLKKI